MAAVADRVRETTTTTGTGTISLGGAVTGFQAFSAAFTTGAVVYYCITDGTAWEVGYGALTSGAPWTLARSTVLASSNAGSLVNWSAGSKDVFCTQPAASIVTSDINESDAIISTSISIRNGKNGFSVSPVTLADGIAITIPTGSTWLIGA